MLINWTSQNSKNIDFLQYGSISVHGGERQILSDRFTDDFISAATADLRCPKAMVEITWANSAVDLNAVITSNDINRVDRTGQMFNGTTMSGRLWAYLHTGLVADGTFKAMPALDSEPQMGWFGSSLVCDGSGDFSTPPYFQMTHDARSYSAILVAGDSQYDEHPVDFTVTFTHSGGPTVITVVGNTERVYSVTTDFIQDVTAVRLEVTKWSEPNTIVKLTQFAGALIELYRDNDIVELNILEETNSDTGAVPIGNVSANELDLSLLNTDRRFSYGNTESPYNLSLISGRKIRVWLGFVLPSGTVDATGDVEGYIVETVGGQKIGYMPYGVYWSKDWISSHDSQVTTTTAYDIAYALGQQEFLKSENYTGTVQSVVDSILTKALETLPDLEWSVSSDTAGILWNNVAFEPKSYLEVLKDVAEATISYTYVNRRGVLVVGSYLGVVTPTEDWQEAGMSDYYNYKSVPKIDELINQVRVGYTKYNIGAPLSEIYSVDETFSVPLSGSATFVIRWSTSPVDISTVNVTLNQVIGEPMLTDIAVYAYGAILTVSGTFGGTFQLSATGTPYELDENTRTVMGDSDSISRYGVKEFSLAGNILVNSVDQARSLATSLLSRYSSLRRDGLIDWPISTLLSIGDALEVIEFKSDTVETKDNFLVKRQSIKFDGSLQGQTELRRG